MAVLDQGERDDDGFQHRAERDGDELPAELRALHQECSDADLELLEVFRAPQFVALSDQITRTPPEMAAQTLNLSTEAIAKFPQGKPEIGAT
jgi:hypothetical protein